MVLSLNKIFVDADKAREKFWMDIITMFKTVATVIKTGKFPNSLETPEAKITKEGGYAIKLQNRTGAESIRGTIVEISPDYDSAIKVGSVSSATALGTIYESGIKNGFGVWVTVSGAGYVLIADGTAATRGEYVTTGAVGGRGYSSSAIPAVGSIIGSLTESVASGQGKTATCTLHFSGAAGAGDVSAGANIADNALVRGDGGIKGIQQATNITVTDLDELKDVGAICFDTAYAEPITEGCVGWSGDEGTLAVGMPGGNVTLNAGMELFLPRRADNNTASIMPNGTLVYIDSGTGNNFSIDLADKRYHATAGRTIAMTTEAIAATTGKGYCTTFGLVRGDALQPIDTSLWPAGTLLWLGNNGTFSATKPSAPDAPIEVGIVFRQHATEGAVFVRVAKQPLELTRQITREPSGFSDPYGVTSKYDATTRKVTLTEKVASTGIPQYWQGEPIETMVTGWVSEAHPDVVSKYMLQYNGTAYEWVDLGSEGLEFSDAFVAFANYSATNPFGIREHHGLMQWQGHRECHEMIGTWKHSGVGAILGNYALSSTTATDRRPSVSASVLYDEDIPTDIAAVVSDGVYTNYYLSGTGIGDANYNLTATDIVPLSGSRPYYNQNNAGTWQQTLIPNNYYMNVWQVQMPVTDDTNSQQYRNLWIQGQTAWATQSGADGETTADVTLGELGLLTNELLFVNKVMIRYQGSNWTWIKTEAISGSKFSQVSTPSGISHDNEAVHVNAAGEIAGITNKASPTGSDLILIEDAADSNNKKYITIQDILDLVP